MTRKIRQVVSCWLSAGEHAEFTAYAKRRGLNHSKAAKEAVLSAMRGQVTPDVVQDPERTFEVPPIPETGRDIESMMWFASQRATRAEIRQKAQSWLSRAGLGSDDLPAWAKANKVPAGVLAMLGD